LEVSDAFGNSVPNVLYTKVAICGATSNCETIDKIQVDTGSAGLRLFRQALPASAPLTPLMRGQSPVGECQSFASGSAWGQVETTMLVLAAEPAVSVSVQVVDATFGKQPPPFPCGAGDWGSPLDIHANGILGIGVDASDSGLYFICGNNACSTLTPQASERVSNPVLLLPLDNNGVIVNLPDVPETGQATANGTLVLGVGTQVDNDPTTYSANPRLIVNLNPADPLFASTTADGQTYSEFAADTGSNAFYFTDSNLAKCPSIFSPILPSPWYCPMLPRNIGVQVAKTGGSQWPFQLYVRDESTLAATQNLALNDLAGDLGDPALFIAGLPFFYGKQVYIGYAGKTSSLGSGPLYAYALR
jgi:Protein of unknown function (DUF3443)